MALSLFRLIKSNALFYYDNDNHCILNSEFENLSGPTIEPIEWYTKEALNHGVNSKTRTPISLRILLGHACNYDCVYCMQKDIGNLHEKPESFHTNSFIESIQSNLDTKNLKRVELWGGEPLLYWKDIVKIIKHFDRDNLVFYISTNGSALSQKHIDFFKTLQSKVELSISHDGPGQEKMRGIDILKKDTKIDIIKQLYELYPKVSFSFNTVLSSSNYDLFEINDYFKTFGDANEMPNVKLMFIPARSYDETNSKNSNDHVIQHENLESFNNIVNDYISMYIEDFKQGTPNRRLLKSGIMEGDLGVFHIAKSYKNEIPITTKSRCGADSSDVLSIDLNNNIRLCPHTNENYISGTLDNLNSVKIKGLSLSRKDTHCKTCSVKRLCKSSCPIDFPDSVFEKNCSVEKTWHSAILQKSFSLLFNEDVEFLGVVNRDL